METPPKVEQTITPVRFEDMVREMYKDRSGTGEYPQGIGYNFVKATKTKDGPYIPTIGANFHPTWIRSNINAIFFEINGTGYLRNAMNQKETYVYGLNSYKVYDFDASKLTDPTASDPLIELTPEEVMVAKNSEDANSIGSWVSDPKIRSRISEWFLAFDKNPSQIRKYITLRLAPFEQDNIPGFDKLTVAGIQAEIDRPGSVRFTEEDMQWLKEYQSHLKLT